MAHPVGPQLPHLIGEDGEPIANLGAVLKRLSDVKLKTLLHQAQKSRHKTMTSILRYELKARKAGAK